MASSTIPAQRPTAAAPASTRQSWASITKGVAIIMVVAYHVTLYLQHSGVDAVLGRAKAVFELFPMPAFFLIAGLFSLRQKDWSFGQLWARRLRPLLYLYVLWSVIRWVFYLVVPGVNGELGELPARDPLSLVLIFLWPSSSYWFLYALLIFTALAWAIRKVPVAIPLVISAVLSTLFTSGLLHTGNLGWDRVGALFVFYFAGVVFSRRIRDAVAQAKPWHAAVAFAVLLASAGLILLGLREIPFAALLGQLASVVLVIVLAQLWQRWMIMKPIATMGDRSLPIYLLHLFVIVPAAALLALLPDLPRIADVGIQAGLFALTLAVAMLLVRLTSRVHWMYVPPRFLTGGRRRPPELRGRDER